MTSVLYDAEALGTKWEISTSLTLAKDEFKRLNGLIAARIHEFEQIYSRFLPNSLVNKMAQRPGIYKLPFDADDLIALYDKLYVATQGAITPCIGELLVALGYDAEYQFKPVKQSLRIAPHDWRDIRYEDGKLHVPVKIQLDFGAAGKGHLIDVLGTLLDDEGVGSYCIDGSGDMLCKNVASPLKVGLEHPTEVGLVIGVLELQDQSLASSAGNRRAWGDWHHILNPQTLDSAREVLASFVVTEKAREADGLATALFVAKPEELLKHFQFEYAMVSADGKLTKSSGFRAEFFTVG